MNDRFKFRVWNKEQQKFVLHWIINDFEGNEKFKYQIQELFNEVSE